MRRKENETKKKIKRIEETKEKKDVGKESSRKEISRGVKWEKKKKAEVETRRIKQKNKKTKKNKKDMKEK